MFLFAGVGGRIPDAIARPLVDGVWPLWRGDPLPGWVFGQRFARTLVTVWAPGRTGLAHGLGGLDLLPLVVVQVGAIAVMSAACDRSAAAAAGIRPRRTDRRGGQAR